jgi:hypothetical protein
MFLDSNDRKVPVDHPNAFDQNLCFVDQLGKIFLVYLFGVVLGPGIELVLEHHLIVVSVAIFDLLHWDNEF